MSVRPGSLKELPFFYSTYDRESNTNFYRLAPSKLSEDEYHLFFPAQMCEEFLISNVMELFTFPPSNRRLNALHELLIVKYDDIPLMWMRFPKEYKDVCERTARLFKMNLVNGDRTFVGWFKDNKCNTVISVPCTEQVLVLAGERRKESELNKDNEFYSQIAKDLDNSRLD